MKEHFLYKIRLNTGEELKVVEIRADELPQDCSKIQIILDKCSRIPREIVEEAKLGHSQRFNPYLKANPSGVLIKFDKICRLIDHCIMADKRICKTSNFKKMPVCWEFGKKEDVVLSPDEELATKIVHFWKEGINVLIVED
jgi:hypothetical protein